MVSTEVDTTIQSEEKITKDDFVDIGTAPKGRYWKEKKGDLIKSENDKMRRQIVYLRKELNTIKNIK